MPGWTTYLDGSFRDGPTEDLGRTGWGFISYDADGIIRAAAFGVPPPWIRSIHGAEMWAVFAALRCSLPGGIYRSDRKAVVSTFAAGRAQATTASDEHARLWDMIFTACDDGDTQLVWMPAHTSAADVGRARLSNGDLLTARDRAANDAADTLAKRGAETHRAPKEVRKQWKQRDLLATWAARTLAIVTHLANNAQCDGSDKSLRDSAGIPRAARRKAFALAQAATRSVSDPSVDTSQADDTVVLAATPSEPIDQPSTISKPCSPTIAVPPDDEHSSSEEEVLILEQIGPPPTAHARMQARELLQQHREREHTSSVVSAIERRCHPKRVACPNTAAVTRVLARTLADSAAGDRPVADNADNTLQPDASASDPQPASLPPCAPQHGCERARLRPTRVSAATGPRGVEASAAKTPAEPTAPDTSLPGQRASRVESTVSFRASGSSNQHDVGASTLRLTALLKLCALDDQGVAVVWPDGLDYLAALELLDSHNAIDFDEVEAWKQNASPSPPPPASAAADSSSGHVEWNARALTDLIELHEDGLPVCWPRGLNVTVAKELLSRLEAVDNPTTSASHVSRSSDS